MSAQPAITRDQFIATSRGAHKSLKWVSAAWMIWILAGIAILFAIMPPELRNEPVFTDLHYGVAFALHVILSIVLMCWNLDATGRRWGVRCPACHHLVTGSHVVIASGNCGHCGTTVLDLQPAQGGVV